MGRKGTSKRKKELKEKLLQLLTKISVRAY